MIGAPLLVATKPQSLQSIQPYFLILSLRLFLLLTFGLA